MTRLVFCAVLLLLVAAAVADLTTTNKHLNEVPHTPVTDPNIARRDCDPCPTHYCKDTTCGECRLTADDLTVCREPTTTLCKPHDDESSYYRDIASGVCVTECDLDCYSEGDQYCANCAGTVNSDTCVCSKTGDDCLDNQCSYDDEGIDKCLWITYDFPFWEDLDNGECLFECPDSKECSDSSGSYYCSDCHKHGDRSDECECDCDANYYGPGCAKRCVASDTCSGHGTCTGSGKCLCEAGFTGKYCDETSNGIVLSAAPILVVMATILAAL